MPKHLLNCHVTKILIDKPFLTEYFGRGIWLQTSSSDMDGIESAAFSSYFEVIT